MNKRQISKISIILAVIVFIISPTFVSAAPSAGIKPNSIFYFLDIASEKIGLFFTFGSEKKAEKALEHAEERLAEVQESANENKPKAVEKAISNYEKNISFATEKSKEIIDEVKAEELLNKVSESTARHQEILAGVLEKVPEEAKEAILKAIEVSKRGHEKALEQIVKLKEEVQELKQKVEKLEEELENKEKDDNDDVEEDENEKEDDKQTKEIEELKKEVEGLKQEKIKNEIEKQTKTNIQPIIQNNSLVKIEKCKAERDKNIASYNILIPGMVDILAQKYVAYLMQQFKSQTDAGINVLPLITEQMPAYRIEKTEELQVNFTTDVNSKYYECINKI